MELHPPESFSVRSFAAESDYKKRKQQKESNYCFKKKPKPPEVTQHNPEKSHAAKVNNYSCVI